MFWIFFLAAVAVLIIWALHKHSASSTAGQSPPSLVGNQGNSVALPTVQPVPPIATQTAKPDITNVPDTHSTSSTAAQSPLSLIGNQGSSVPTATVQPPPPHAGQAAKPGVTNIPSTRTRASGLRSPSARWVPPGETVEVAGFSLPKGMLYVGRGLQPIKEWALDAEPALLDPTLPVDKHNADFEGRLMSYWPSYSDIPPACRSAYLQWLAGGRSAPKAGIGYVFLFFYGLERRMLFDNTQSQVPTPEIDAICAELERLLAIYGGSNSFRRYASNLHGLGLLLRRTIDTDELRPPMQRDGWELPITVRLALGVFAINEKPLPPEWALSWVLTSPELYLRTPAQRCPEEFRELYLLRYRESFGDGIRLRVNKTRLKIEYQPASASFGGVVTLTTDLPDVAHTSATFDRLRQLAEQCTQELDPYSRWVGRTGETDSPPAIALLPAPLARDRGNEATQALCGWLEAQLDSHNLALIDSSGLLTQWPSKEQGRPSRRELETLSDFLASRGIGIEPDVALGGASLARARRAALFRLPGGTREKPSPAYKGAAVLLHLAAMVAAADGEVSIDEERHLMEHLDASLNLSEADRARLEAYFRWLTADPPTLTRAKKSIEEVDKDERHALGSFLISLAGADGHLAPDEVKVLSKMYPLLGLDPQTVYSDMHQLMSAQRAPAEEPVPVRPAELPQGFAIPRPSQAASQAVELDLDKVRAKLAETERVSRLLGEIFVDEETVAPAPPPAQAPGADDYTIAGLDSPHSALLLHLAGSATWERAQVERLADALGLLPDGALEVINETAFTVCGAPLLEGDELIEIDKEVLQEMLP
ncbi:MAG TPA: TerB N-terminal domain-containing protein [Thermoanaerobaculia bacterium]|nr:TerB N-terminal domain-containing protein [Thermoanaerobaculia bacterium]